MKCDRFEVLHKVVRITNCTAFDYPQSFKSILRFLVKSLHLEEASFQRLDAGGKGFSHLVKASGTDFFVSISHSIDHTPEGEALKGRRPVSREAVLHFPVFNHRRSYGVLSLRTSPDHPVPKDLLNALPAVCDQLAGLAQYASVCRREERRVKQHALLSDLAGELNQARTSRELLLATLRIVLRHSGAAAVILRPLYKGTILGRSHVRIRKPFRAYRPLLLDLEEKQATLAFSEGVPVFRRGLAEGKTHIPALPSAMATFPLLFQGNVLGTLTLFGGEGEKGISLALKAEENGLFTSAASQIAHALERIMGRERLASISAENDRKLREITLLYRISRAMHGTLGINALMHLILSAATAPEGGGFERAMLFMVNERSGNLQGMLGVTRETAALVLPPAEGDRAWERPSIGKEAIHAQRQTPFCRQVMKLRLPLLAEDNALARAACQGRVVTVLHPEEEPPSGGALAETLELAPFACAPLLGRERTLGVLVVDNPVSREGFGPSRLRFLEMFASQAGGAMENSKLINRLQTAHNDLQEAQDRMLQREKMAVLGEMAASVAHDLRNPLVSIGGFAQRLAKVVTPDSREHEYASIVAREVRRMEEMLSNILAFSRKQMLCFSECRIEEIIEEVLSLEAGVLKRASIDLAPEIADDLPAIQGDGQKLRQVLINLVTNARQAMRDGGTLSVRAYRTTLRGEPAVAVEVEDTGGGIPIESLPNIFSPFFTTKEEGTGLGLSISHRIVEHHQGEMTVENRECGARFTLRLPVQKLGLPLR